MNRKHLILVPLVVIGALIAYKTQGSIAVLRGVSGSGELAARPEVVALGSGPLGVGALGRTLNYMTIIAPALIFGVLISAAVRAFVSERWIAGAFGAGSTKAHLWAGLAGAPMMLCSCCVAPVYRSIAEKTARSGPAITVMLAAPSLNPAALLLTFLLFQPELALGRLVMAALIVFAGSPIIERALPHVMLPPPAETALPAEPDQGAIGLFLKSLGSVSIRTVPVLIVGVIASMFLLEWMPANLFSSPGSQVVAILAVATIAVPVALPTFFEVPIALTLLAAGFPPGAALAILVAGPAVNLPSLLTVGRFSGWKMAAAVAALVWLVAVVGGIIVG